MLGKTKAAPALAVPFKKERRLDIVFFFMELIPFSWGGAGFGGDVIATDAPAAIKTSTIDRLGLFERFPQELSYSRNALEARVCTGTVSCVYLHECSGANPRSYDMPIASRQRSIICMLPSVSSQVVAGGWG